MDRPRTPPPSYSEVLMMDVMYGQVSPHASNETSFVECLPPPQSSRSAWNLWNKRRKTFAFLVLTGLAIAMILFIAFVIYVFNVNRRKK
uniref:U24 n=1 Tax=Human betaherpesvirus 6 TaxID=10368 RepID=A0A1W6JFY5_9BETA|nr:U24 [Human betaherpesvirus 6]